MSCSKETPTQVFSCKIFKFLEQLFLTEIFIAVSAFSDSTEVFQIFQNNYSEALLHTLPRTRSILLRVSKLKRLLAPSCSARAVEFNKLSLLGPSCSTVAGKLVAFRTRTIVDVCFNFFPTCLFKFEPRPSLKRSGFSGQILIKLRL